MKNIDSICHSIIRELFPSAEMADYLTQYPIRDVYYEHCGDVDRVNSKNFHLWRSDIERAIAGAPISLKRKSELLNMLAKEDNYFSETANWLQKILLDISPKLGEILTLRSYSYDGAGNFEEEFCLPFLSWEYLFEYIENCWNEDNDEVWFVAEKWTPDENGRLINSHNYTILNRQICYVDAPPPHEHHEFSPYTCCQTELPVPFHVGDIVTIDCRPYAPVSHVVILGIGDNCDCCCVQALYREDDGTWDKGALKHGSIFPISTHSPGFSPLYRLASFKGKLPEEERLLEEVCRYIDGDEKKGNLLWRFVSEGTTEEEILDFIGQNGDTQNEHE